MNRGRPSNSCLPCRERRIKCDKAKPACSQCSRVRNFCRYRDPLDRIFRHYHRPTHAEAPAECSDQRHDPNSKQEEALALSMNDPGNRKKTPTVVLQSTLSTPIEDVALAAFMSTFAPGSRFEYVLQLYPHSDTNGALCTSLRAVSMAFLSQEVGQVVPHRCYTEALTATNAALSDPSLATQDTTLASILLLTLFETLMWLPSRTPRSYMAHIQGAVTLVRLRGAQQLETELGRSLFRQVFVMILVNRIRDRIRPPPELVALLRLVKQFEGDSIRHHLAHLTNKASHHIATVYHGGMDAQDAISLLRRLDEQYIAFMQRLAFEMPYQTIPKENFQDREYGVCHHLYNNYHEAQVWNSARMTRIFLNEAIYGQARKLEYSLAAPIHAQAIRNMDHMIIEICDSVPQFISSDPRCSNPRPFSLKPSIATFLLPLVVVYESSFTTESLHAYIVERLKYLGGETSVSTTQRAAIQSCSLETFSQRLFMLYSL